MSYYLLYEPWKCEIPKKNFGWVIKISLGDYFFAHSVLQCESTITYTFYLRLRNNAEIANDIIQYTTLNTDDVALLNYN